MFSKVKREYKEKHLYWNLLFSCWFLYVIMMVCKTAYNAEIIEIMNSFQVTKSIAGYASTVYFFTYGFMQLFLAKILPKINLRWYLSLTMLISVICTVCLGLATEIWQIVILLGFNGIFHAAVWPSCVLIVSEYLPNSMQSTANGIFSAGFTVGFIVSYVLSAIFIAFFSWRTIFLVSGIVTILPITFFYINFRKVEKERTPSRKDKKSEENKFYTNLNHKLVQKYLNWFYIIVLLVNFFANIVYYGMNNWVPSLIYDVFHLPSSIATLISTLVPVVGTVGPIVALIFTNRYNLWYVVTAITSISALLVFILTFSYDTSLIFSVSVSVLVLMLLRGITNSISTTLSLKTHRLFNAGSFIAVINAFSSFGASFAPTVTGKIIDVCSRHWYYIFLFAILLIIIVLILILDRITKRLKVLKNLF